jgi:hypothetical protein
MFTFPRIVDEVAVLLVGVGSTAGWWLVAAVAAGLIPEEVCAECADLRLGRTPA